MNTEQTLRARLRDWVVAKSGKIRSEQLDDHTPILEQRIITSLQVMDLILFLEQLSGRAIEVEMLQAGALRSIDTLYRTFFEAEVTDAY